MAPWTISGMPLGCKKFLVPMVKNDKLKKEWIKK
jgi:hypothetical protein